MFPEAKPRGTLRVSEKQNSLFPLGPVIKCLKKMLLQVVFTEHYYSRKIAIFSRYIPVFQGD